jgi:chromosome segregation ATPase
MEALMQKSLIGLFRREDPLEDPLEEAFATMEEDMAAIVDFDVEAPPVDAYEEIFGTEEADQPVAADDGHGQGTASRLTTYAQSGLAALSVYEEVHRSAQQDLEQLAASLARVVSSHHSTTSFVSSVHGSILRANELELTNATLLSENRRLSHAADRVRRLSSQLETLTEGYKRKEAKMEEHSETMRASLAVAQAELNEARSAHASVEFERAELLNQLAGKSAALERVTREAEMMRERHVNTALDLENAQRNHMEIERKYNELSAVHATEHSMISELRGKLSETELEVSRLQKALDTAQARLSEAQQANAQQESETARLQHDQVTENQKLRREIDALRARIEVAGRAQRNADNELGELKHKVAELTMENTIAAEKIAGLAMELASERKLAASREMHMPDDESSAATIEAQAREIDMLRREHAEMRDTIKRLAAFERDAGRQPHGGRQDQSGSALERKRKAAGENIPHAAE